MEARNNNKWKKGGLYGDYQKKRAAPNGKCYSKNPNDKFLISGAVGSGKNFLLNILGKVLKESGKKVKYRALPFCQAKGYKHYEKELKILYIYLIDWVRYISLRQLLNKSEIVQIVLFILYDKIFLISNLIMS